MKAAAWIMYALLCFGAATVTTMAVSSPGGDLPAGAADSLMSDLDAITGYAGEGRCDAVSGRADRAQSTIDRLPASTSDDLVRELQRSVGRIRTTALRECADAARASREEADRQRQAEQDLMQETTPPEPDPQPTEPDPGTTGDPADGPDPGTGEGTTPDDGSSGGVTPGELGQQLQDGVRDMQQRTEESAREWRDRLREAIR